MEEIKRFDINKANELLKVYKKKRQFGKVSFLKELISYQNFFGDKSILDCDLLLSKNYQKRTVETVLSDLGYSLVYPLEHCMHFFICSNNHHRFVRIKFK